MELELRERMVWFIEKFCLGCENFDEGECLAFDFDIDPENPEFIEETDGGVICQEYTPELPAHVYKEMIEEDLGEDE